MSSYNFLVQPRLLHDALGSMRHQVVSLNSALETKDKEVAVLNGEVTNLNREVNILKMAFTNVATGLKASIVQETTKEVLEALKAAKAQKSVIAEADRLASEAAGSMDVAEIIEQLMLDKRNMTEMKEQYRKAFAKLAVFTIKKNKDNFELLKVLKDLPGFAAELEGVTVA
jgi:hypothetical protein